MGREWDVGRTDRVDAVLAHGVQVPDAASLEEGRDDGALVCDMPVDTLHPETQRPT